MEKSLVRDYLLEQQKKKLPWLVERELEVPETKRKIISVFGPRRAGKTYYFYQLMKKAGPESLYLNFEDTRLMGVNFQEIRELIRLAFELVGRKPQVLFLDEVQNVEKWEKAVREILDLGQYRILVTGSSSKLLAREIATSLRGRTLSYLLLPFSFGEYLGAKEISFRRLTKDEQVAIKRELRQYLEFGGFPEVVLEKEKEKILKEFYDLTLFRDMVERYHLKNLNLVKFLLAFLAQNFSQPISLNKIGRFFKSQGKTFGKNTLYDYVDKMQDSVAFFFLSRYSEKVYTRESWPKKVYLADLGFSRVVRFSPDWGSLMENAVFLKLLRETNKDPLREIYFYQDTGGREVDFLLKKGQKVRQLVQVCQTIEGFSTRERELKNLVSASEKTGCSDLQVITWDEEAREKFKGKEIKLAPLWKWLLRD